jgi:RecA-family ATPase
MLSLPKSKSKIEKDIDDYVSANDFVAASEIYKDIKIKPIKEQMFLLEKSLSNKEQERIKALLQSAEKFGFEFVKTLYKQSINYDDEEIDFEKFDKIIEREWLIENLIPKGKITVFAGLGGSGKTTIALQWMLNMLLGINVANGIETKQIERAMIISAEEDKEEIVGKINSLLYKYFTIVTGKKYETLQTELDYRIKIITKHKILTTTIFEKVTTTEDYVVVNNYIEDFNPDLIIIDSLTSTNMVEIQKSSIAQSVMLLIEKLVRNRSCILLHHLAKDAINSKDIKDISIDQVLGSASLANKVRQVLLLHKNKLKVGKSNLLSFDAIANTYYSLEEIVDSKGVTINWGWKIRKIRVLRQHQQKQKMTRKEIIKQKQKQIQIQKQIKEDKNED